MNARDLKVMLADAEAAQRALERVHDGLVGRDSHPSREQSPSGPRIWMGWNLDLASTAVQQLVLAIINAKDDAEEEEAHALAAQEPDDPRVVLGPHARARIEAGEELRIVSESTAHRWARAATELYGRSDLRRRADGGFTLSVPTANEEAF